jgi:hypothetical protein
MKVKTICDAKVLVPNKDHKNFTELPSGEIIEKGTLLEGNEKFYSGLRRGEDFVYRVFVTNNGKIIYLNTIEPVMDNVEILLNAGGPEASVTMADKSVREYRFAGAILGAIAGLGYAEMKKQPFKTGLIYGIIGAGIGYGAARLIYKSNTVTAKIK